MISNRRTIVLLLLTGLLAANLHARAQPKYPVRKYSDLQRLNIKLPYVRYYGKDCNLVVYGSNHTTDYYDPQVSDIQEKLCAARPSVVLYEGDGIATGNSMRATVAEYFEMGQVKYIADSLKIPTVNIEPPTAAKYQYLLSRFSADEVMLATLGLQITMMQAANEDFAKKYPYLVADLVKEGFPLPADKQSIYYFYRIYRKYFGKGFSYTFFDSRDIQAKYNRTTLNKVNQTANEFRDQHILSLVDSLLTKKQKVYLQIGGWHAIVCEPAFAAMTEGKK